MNKPLYNKPHISYEDQVEKLISRGMAVADRAAAIHILQHVNYYRLGVYWHSFEQDHVAHTFKAGTRFEDVVALYEFDRLLRSLVMDAIERIEVSFRTQWTYHLSAAYGSHAHMVQKAHSAAWPYTVEELNREIARTDEIFIKRLMQKYGDATPPIWAVSEIMSFGLMSKWFKNLRVNTVRKNIAHIYGVHPDILESWMQHLCVVRNSCAHHSRLWNRRFDRAAPKHPAILQPEFVPGHPLANTLVILLYLLDVISPGHHWRQRFLALLEQYPATPLAEMGLAPNWRQQAIWTGRVQ